MVGSRDLGFVLLAVMLAVGCSGGMNPVGPTVDPYNPGQSEEPDSGRVLWGMWSISFDPDEMAVAIIETRSILAHFNVAEMLLPPACDNCLEIHINSFNPDTRVLDADVMLRNPMALKGYDVRGILFTDNSGHTLLNADAWTGLWEIPGGKAINPFKAYNKFSLNRGFPGGKAHTEKYLVYIPIPPMWGGITYAVDASWPGNCKEPYEITDFIQLGYLHDTIDSQVELQVEVRDHQDNVDEVLLVAPEITGEDYTYFSHLNWAEWTLDLKNNTGAPAGTYDVLLMATSTDSGDLALYNYATVTISESETAIDPVDVTPPWLYFTPEGVCIAGDYAYVAGGDNGLHIFDVSDPSNAIWVHKVDVFCHEVDVDGDYAFTVPSSPQGLGIINIESPESAYLVTTFDAPGQAMGLDAEGDFVYLACGPSGLHIIDVSSPETPYIVNTVEPGYLNTSKRVAVEGGYAYELGQDFRIIDIDPPESAYVVNSLNLSGILREIEVEDGYVYIVGSSNLTIIDVDPPDSIHVVKTVNGAYSRDIAISGDYAYLGISSLTIVDIKIPESAEIIKYVPIPDHIWWYIAEGNGYAYVTNKFIGMDVIDVIPPESAELVKTVYTMPSPAGVAVDGNFAFVINENNGLYIADITNPETAHIINWLKVDGHARGLAVEGEYAYIAAYALRIFDVIPPESAYLVSSYNIQGIQEDVAYDNGYAYLVLNSVNLAILDVDPPDSLGVAGIIDEEGISGGEGVAVADGYAYIAAGESGLLIADVDPPESAHIANIVDTSGEANGVFVEGGYAYVADFYEGLKIVDIDPIESAYIVGDVAMPGDATFEVAVINGYALVAGWYYGLHIVDIDPPETAYIIKTLDTPGNPVDVCIQGDYAYVADWHGGLRIIKLW